MAKIAFCLEKELQYADNMALNSIGSIFAMQIKKHNFMEDTNNLEEKDDKNLTNHEGEDINGGDMAKDSVEQEIENLKRQIEEQKDKFLRLFAEFDNYKKRLAKERVELLSMAGRDIILEILPVADDIERAVKASIEADEVETVREGLGLIADKFKKVLEKRGVRPIDAIGSVFDVEKHEAITEIPAQSEEMKGKIVDEIEKGYMMNDKIIRFSKVVVGK